MDLAWKWYQELKKNITLPNVMSEMRTWCVGSMSCLVWKTFDLVLLCSLNGYPHAEACRELAMLVERVVAGVL